MHVRNNNKKLYKLLLKSLIVIMSMQLVVLQVKAITVSSTHHQPCSQMEMATDFIQDEHHGAHHTSAKAEKSMDKCQHCEDFSLDCYNGCHTSAMYTLSFVPYIELAQSGSFYLSPSFKQLVSFSQQPVLQPPR